PALRRRNRHGYLIRRLAHGHADALQHRRRDQGPRSQAFDAALGRVSRMSFGAQGAFRVRGHETDVGGDGAHHHLASARCAREAVALQPQAPGTSRPHTQERTCFLSQPYPGNPVPPEKAQTARRVLTALGGSQIETTSASLSVPSWRFRGNAASAEDRPTPRRPVYRARLIPLQNRPQDRARGQRSRPPSAKPCDRSRGRVAGPSARSRPLNASLPYRHWVDPAMAGIAGPLASPATSPAILFLMIGLRTNRARTAAIMSNTAAM